jgi:hypothetical protein
MINKKVSVQTKDKIIVGTVVNESTDFISVKDEYDRVHVIEKVTSIIKIIEVATVLVDVLSKLWKKIKSVF